MYYNEELVTNSKVQTQLSRKLQRFRTCRKNKKCSIFHDLSEYIIFHMIVTYWTGPLNFFYRLQDWDNHNFLGQNAKRNDQSTMYEITFNISNNLWYAYDEDSPKYTNLFPYLCKVPPQAGPPPCPEGAFAGVNGDDCFMFHKDPVDWGTAKYNGCNDSKLASIQDAFENALITSNFQNKNAVYEPEFDDAMNTSSIF